MRAAIFDLDGTLADSAPDIASALNRAFVEDGLAPFDLATVKKMVGAGARMLVRRGLAYRMSKPIDSDVERLHGRFIGFYNDQPCVATHLYPGALDTLATLHAQGWKLGICTNKPQALADQVVKSLGINLMFESIVGGRQGVRLKPSGEMLQLVLNELAVPFQRAVMIGDSAADIGAARAAGVPVIVFAHGYSDQPAADLGADISLANFDGLAAAMKNLCEA